MAETYVVISEKVEDFKVNPATSEIVYVGEDKERAFSKTLDEDEFLTLQVWVNGEFVSMYTKEGRFPFTKWSKHFDKRETLKRKIEKLENELGELKSELSKIQGE